MALTLTKFASEKILEVMTNSNTDPNNSYVRLTVKGGGCSGYKTDLFIQPNKELNQEEDEIFVSEFNNIRIVTNHLCLTYIDGTEVDYIEDNSSLMKRSGFKLNNPMANSKCGCGESFSV